MKIIKNAPNERKIDYEKEKAEFHSCACYNYVISRIEDIIKANSDIFSIPVDIEKPEASAQILILQRKLIQELIDLKESL